MRDIGGFNEGIHENWMKGYRRTERSDIRGLNKGYRRIVWRDSEELNGRI